MSDEARPCPFCGRAVTIRNIGGAIFVEHSVSGCVLDRLFEYLAKWNIRPAEDKLLERVASLDKQNDYLSEQFVKDCATHSELIEEIERLKMICASAGWTLLNIPSLVAKIDEIYNAPAVVEIAAGLLKVSTEELGAFMTAREVKL
jgi:hypothetical protein